MYFTGKDHLNDEVSFVEDRPTNFRLDSCRPHHSKFNSSHLSVIHIQDMCPIQYI